ncbi:flagellar hook-associated protein FlgK [Campylobacter californiensis]|uniref:flagellar hook-associated protein FlgK n=1 Tax=Campylobacter californiensis TaxID=1032243 RepID=UPI001472A1B9|nr:flagellar hook-associated protein FlgK [Campylobacter sp. RM12916]MBE3609164.1 flagellar hook-associated protein FlgK [Campylobacter sp. RM12916]
MANIFMSLNTGISGLNAAQLQISTTGNNISNADSNYYTRQRVVQSAAPAMNTVPGGVGMGTQVDTITRIHDEFTYSRLKLASSNSESTDYKQRILQEIAQNFPDLDDRGIVRDIQNYFGAWNDFASNPDEGSQKVNLLNLSSVLSSNLNQAAKTLDKIQYEIDDMIKINIEEINDLAKQISNINKEILRVESGRDAGIKINANDLRDKRDELELAISRLVNVSTYKSDLSSNSQINTGITDQGRYYSLNIGGVSIIDGVNFHPLSIDETANGGFSQIYYEREDGKRIPMENYIQNGKVGAALDLRGRNYDTSRMKFTDGTVQKYIDNLDTFAKTLIDNTNNIYAQSAVEVAATDEFSFLEDSKTLMNYNEGIRQGSFDVIVYNNQGEEIARKTIKIDGTTTMNDTTYGNSIVSDFNSNSDDNNDNNMTNDVNDYFSASYAYDKNSNKGLFAVTPKFAQGTYSIAFVDNGTNFPGVIGVNKFFTGDNAKNIDINDEFKTDHTKIRAYSKPVTGNNSVANGMVQLQYSKLTFYSNGIAMDREETIEGFYRYVTTDIASDTESNNLLNETNTSLIKTAESEFQSISGVDTNEELTNLIRFQASYGAAAKIITTVDQMLDTLLSLKQ